jgi:hypothetical protein
LERAHGQVVDVKVAPAYGQRRENEARRRGGGGVERRRKGPNIKQHKTSKLTRRAAIAQQPLLQPKLAPAVGQVRNLHLFLQVRDQVGSWVRHGDVRVDGLSWSSWKQKTPWRPWAATKRYLLGWWGWEGGWVRKG